jgi:hypothetical protein
VRTNDRTNASQLCQRIGTDTWTRCGVTILTYNVIPSTGTQPGARADSIHRDRCNALQAIGRAKRSAAPNRPAGRLQKSDIRRARYDIRVDQAPRRPRPVTCTGGRRTVVCESTWRHQVSSCASHACRLLQALLGQDQLTRGCGTRRRGGAAR